MSVNESLDINNNKSNSNVSSNICGRKFSTNSGLLLNLNVCRRKQQQQQQQQQQ